MNKDEDQTEPVPLNPSETPSRAGSFVSQRRHKPRLTVDERYDLVTPQRDIDDDRAQPDLDPLTFDVQGLSVATKVQVAFTARYDVEPEAAIDQLRLLARHAIVLGTYRRLASGFHSIGHLGFIIWLSPDGQIITAYRPRDDGDSPAEVLSGSHGRLEIPARRRRWLRNDDGRRLTFMQSLEIGEIRDGIVVSATNFGVFVHIGGMDGLVHVSEMDRAPGQRPRDLFGIGTELQVRIIGIDTERSRISLSIEDPS